MDVDTEQFAFDLRKLAEEIRSNRALVDGIRVTRIVEAEESESVRLTLDFTPTEGSRFFESYDAPYEDDA